MRRWLASLDGYVLPRLSRAAGQVRSAVWFWPRLRASALGHSAGSRVRSALTAGDRLDARLPVAGPLAKARELPVLAVAAAGLVLFAGCVAAIDVHPRRSVAPIVYSSRGLVCGLSFAADGSAYVGPAAAANVGSYISGRDAILSACAQQQPARQSLAVVSLRSALAPKALAMLVGRLAVMRVYLSVAGRPDLYADTTGGRTAAAAASAMREVASQLSLDAALETEQAASDTGLNTAASQGYFTALAKSEQRESVELDAGCACDYAVVVDGSLQQLAALSSQAQVRLVDVAPVGTSLSAATFEPLDPTEVTTVGGTPPQQFVAGDPQDAGSTPASPESGSPASAGSQPAASRTTPPAAASVTLVGGG